MTDRPNFIKIRANILIDPNVHFVFDENNKMSWNMERLDDFYNADIRFRDPIIDFINEEVGLNNWAIRFHPFYTNEYEAYIYCENDDQYHKIITIISERLKDEKFRLFAKRGTVDDYIAGR